MVSTLKVMGQELGRQLSSGMVCTLVLMIWQYILRELRLSRIISRP